MAKRSVSIYFSPRILKRIDEEALKDKRSRSAWLEKHLEEAFSKPQTQETEVAIKMG
jgi:predicted transcriptional regulator